MIFLPNHHGTIIWTFAHFSLWGLISDLFLGLWSRSSVPTISEIKNRLLDQSLRGYSQNPYITEFFHGSSPIYLVLISHWLSITSSLLFIGPPGTATKYHLEEGTQPGPFAGSVRSCTRIGSLPLIWLNLGMSKHLTASLDCWMMVVLPTVILKEFFAPSSWRGVYPVIPRHYPLPQIFQNIASNYISRKFWWNSYKVKSILQRTRQFLSVIAWKVTEN